MLINGLTLEAILVPITSNIQIVDPSKSVWLLRVCTTPNNDTLLLSEYDYTKAGAQVYVPLERINSEVNGTPAVSYVENAATKWTNSWIILGN